MGIRLSNGLCPSNLGAPAQFIYNPRFLGQMYDRETNLHYNYFRDYDPQVGRYVQSDPIGLGAGTTNTFGYVGGDPVSFFDPSGLTRRNVDLGDGYSGGIDTFNKGGSASWEMHVFDKKGAEVGVYGPNGWIKKHGHDGNTPSGVPSSVLKQCETQGKEMQKRIFPNVDSPNKAKRFFSKAPLVGPLIDATRPSPERYCELNPQADGC
jgi:RHS repeat-associated protein